MLIRQWDRAFGYTLVVSLLVDLVVGALCNYCLAADPAEKAATAPTAKPATASAPKLAGGSASKAAAEAEAKVAADTIKLPMLVFIYSRECPVCAKVKPVVAELVKEYGSRAKFVDLDVTDDKSTLQSKKLAKDLQLKSFFALYQDTFPCVGIFDTRMKCVKELFGANPKKTYVSYLEKVTTSSK